MGMSNTIGQVLYAEDDNNDVFLLQRAFQKVKLEGFQTVRDGQQAVNCLRACESDPAKSPLPTLVLLDINLPFLSGLEVLSWIRELPAFKLLPVWIFTSSNQDKDVELAYRLHATAYVTKPSSANKLVEFADALRAFLKRSPSAAFDYSRVPGYRPPPVIQP